MQPYGATMHGGNLSLQTHQRSHHTHLRLQLRLYGIRHSVASWQPAGLPGPMAGAAAWPLSMPDEVQRPVLQAAQHRLGQQLLQDGLGQQQVALRE